MGHVIAKYSLAPLLLGQGVYVKKTIQRLPEPSGARRGVNGSGQALRLLVLGDSAAAGVGVETQTDALLGQLVSHLEGRFETHWALIAKTGATSASTLKHLHKIPSEPFDAVVISLGVNDVTANHSLERFLKNQQSIVALLHEKFGVSLIVVSGFPPVGLFPALPQPLRWYLGLQSRRFDRALARVVNTQTDCVYFRQNLSNDPTLMAADGFHPGARAYALWARETAALIVAKRA
jgi:lysophospholipase L1-like esterase